MNTQHLTKETFVEGGVNIACSYGSRGVTLESEDGSLLAKVRIVNKTEDGDALYDIDVYYYACQRAKIEPERMAHLAGNCNMMHLGSSHVFYRTAYHA